MEDTNRPPSPPLGLKTNQDADATFETVPDLSGFPPIKAKESGHAPFWKYHNKIGGEKSDKRVSFFSN